METVVIMCSVRILSEGIIDTASHALSNFLFGHGVTLRLVSLCVDPVTKEGKLSPKSKLKLVGGINDGPDSLLDISFNVDEGFGKPGAILIESTDSNEFYLKTITLTMPNNTTIHFSCYSWINHRDFYMSKPRVFFSNEPYVPQNTPQALLKYREDDLLAIQGDGKGQRVDGQRIYDYDVYNDLSNIDFDENLARPILGGSTKHPYPRRCRTGRKCTMKDPSFEQPETSFDGTYVPRDERFSALKKSLFMAVGVRSFGHNVAYTLVNVIHNDGPFQALEDIHDLYAGSLKRSSLVRRDVNEGTPIIEFPPPRIVSTNKDGWMLDSEFGRQRLAGVNPLVIEQLKVFPPVSTLDPEIYGDPLSALRSHHIEPLMEGFTVEEAMKNHLLYILDYHDVMMPFINKINELDGKAYASRTILYLKRSKELVPIAIELSLPPKEKGEEAPRRVFTSNITGYPDWFWRLAKTHVSIIDTGYHQLISHWLRTHACIEPIVISSRRNLSRMHPIYNLLEPHFKDTMHINAWARASLINAGGKIERHYSATRYSMEISSAAYKTWRFDQESLPKDLIKRGMAVEDPSAKHGLRLTIEDYPYAVDGLDLWEAINTWVTDYVKIYYNENKVVEEDVELQRWWIEIKEVGHGDHSKASWWSPMKTIDDLIDVLSTIIWVASAHHAAVNFGQYEYGGYMPNSPCMARCLIPELGTSEYATMLENPESFLLKMLPSQSATAFAMCILEILAQHLSEEVYLGERIDPKWTCDARALLALKKFRENLIKVESNIELRNAKFETLHHRAGPVLLPYTLLSPSSPEPGLTFRGIPNSISM